MSTQPASLKYEDNIQQTFPKKVYQNKPSKCYLSLYKGH